MEDEVQIQAAETAKSNGLGFWGKFGNIFANPQKTFLELDQRPKWLIPVIIIILISILITLATYPIIIESQLEMFRNNPNISAEQFEIIQQRIEAGGQAQKYIGLVMQVVGIFVFYYLLFAGIFYFVGSVILGGDCKYKKVLAVWAWSSLIGVAAAIVRVPLVFLKENIRISISPALLLPADSLDSVLYTILSQFDFFLIWQLAVFAFGFSIIYKMSIAKSYITVGVLWGIWIAIAVAASDIFKQFGIM